jgi:hypothetical protein
VEGYLVGLLTTYAVSTVAYVLVLRKVFPFLQYGRILRTLAVLAFVNTGLAVPFIVAQPLIVSGGLLPGLLIATGVYGGLLLLANRLWRLNDDVDTWLNTLGHALRRTKR